MQCGGGLGREQDEKQGVGPFADESGTSTRRSFYSLLNILSPEIWSDLCRFSKETVSNRKKKVITENKCTTIDSFILRGLSNR